MLQSVEGKSLSTLTHEPCISKLIKSIPLSFCNVFIAFLKGPTLGNVRATCVVNQSGASTAASEENATDRECRGHTTRKRSELKCVVIVAGRVCALENRAEPNLLHRVECFARGDDR